MSMKKKIFASLLFICGFAVTYGLLCYCPWFRIKLFAPPLEYFVASLKNMAFFKSFVSLAGGMVLAALPYMIRNSKYITRAIY